MTRSNAAAGALAVLLALALGELVAGLVPAVPSPIDAVGQLVVVAAPGAVATWAIDTFGAANRAVVTGGTLVIALAIGAAIGMAACRSLLVPLAVVVGVGALALAAMLSRPGTPFPLALLTAVAMAAVAATTLVVLTERLRGRPTADPDPAAADPWDPPVARRAVLTSAAGLAAAGVVTLVAGRYVLGGRVATVDPSTVALPPPARALPAPDPDLDLATRVDGVSPALTPTDGFYRIDTALTVPRVDHTTWRLRVHGRVDREVELTYDDLLALPLEEHDVTIACVSNEVGGDLIGTARWLGVLLADVLDLAGVRDDAEQVVGRAVDGWTAGFPVEAVDAGALVVVGMNGAALPPRHGFPVRLVVPGLYGYVSATKWLTELELTSWEGYDAYWVPRGWAKRGPIKPASRIDVPAAGAERPAGEVVVAGVAWAPPGGVEAVELQVDDGPWEPAELVLGTSPRTWVQWLARPDLAAGEHRLRVRAVDAAGDPQPEGPAPPAPDGAEGWHTVTVEVT